MKPFLRGYFILKTTFQEFVWVKIPSPLRGEGWERVTDS
jgi:hypothetical protein